MNVLLTGGTGRLGTELQTELKGRLELSAPSHQDLDITNLESIQKALAEYHPDVVVHTAAYTDVSGAENERAACWNTNVIGTRNLVKALQGSGAALIHISTDYVFYGDAGGYKEDAPLGPVRNYYALTKLVAEESVRAYSDHLLIRTSFRPREWPYEVAFDDIYTSQDYVDIIAPEIALATENVKSIPFDTLHIATERKTVYDLASRRKPDVKRGSKKDVVVALPEDISLDSSRWQNFKSELGL